MRHVYAVLLGLTGTLAAGCSTTPTLGTPERLALYREHAQAPVPSFRLTRMTGTQNWTPLGDQALAVWSSANRGHLIELRVRCPGMRMASNIAITNRTGTVTARIDSVLPRTATGLIPVGSGTCRIETIRPLDAATLRDAQRELRNAEYIEQSAVPSGTEEVGPSPGT